MGIFHDGASFDLTVFFKQARDIGFVEARMDAGDEEIGAGVASG